MTDHIRRVLAAKYPEHAAVFKANAAALEARLDALAAELEGDLAPITDKPYIVFHDAFQYLERRFGLNVVGSISISPDVPPSARRLTELRRKIQSLGAVCVFAEPAFDRRLVDSLMEGTSARTGTLDAEGGSLDPGPDLYFTLMRTLASALKGCLGAAA
jgi:zinc transport system substrate-binding protein